MQKRLTSWVLYTIALLACSASCYGQRPVPSEQDIADVITLYRTNTVSEKIKTLQAALPPPSRDKKLRDSIYQTLNPAFNKRVTDPLIIGKLREILMPVLSLYGREQAYDLIIARNPMPVVMDDSGVVLVITTGMLQSVESDDELLGDIAHEIGHEAFVDYWAGCNYLMSKYADRDGYTVLQGKLAVLMALIELHCDAFAALTLSYLKYDPLAFIRGLERLEKAYAGQPGNIHPHVSTRRRVVEAVVSSASIIIQPRQSNTLKELRQLITSSLEVFYLNKTSSTLILS